MRLTLGVTDAEVAQGARAEVTFTVENRSQQHVLYNASPGPRLRMRAGDKVVWDGGCGMAYPAVYSERTLAPGERVEYRATYPVADAARDAECRPAPGSYELTGWFQGCKRGPADPSGVTGYRCETEMTTVEARPITFRQR